MLTWHEKNVPSTRLWQLNHFNLKLKAKTSIECEHKMPSPSPSAPAKSQYHHFIPRLILRNFAYPYKPPDNLPNGSAKHSKRKRKNDCHSGEPMLHAINLAEAAACFFETPVSHTFELIDMYRDFTHATNQHYLEEQLSRLESCVGTVINTIRKTFETKKREMWISRSNRDILRKFLFIMKYRGSSTHKRFYHHSAEDYSKNDRKKLLNYMREKGFESSVDVWFDNIKIMLKLKMNQKLEWIKKLMNRIYSNDAKWYVANTQMMYLALCTPSDQDEFLLMKNAYSVHKRSVIYLINSDSSELTATSYRVSHIRCYIVKVDNGSSKLHFTRSWGRQQRRDKALKREHVPAECDLACSASEDKFRAWRFICH